MNGVADINAKKKIKIFNQWDSFPSVVFSVAPSKLTTSLQAYKHTQISSILRKFSLNQYFLLILFYPYLPLVPALLFFDT